MASRGWWWFVALPLAAVIGSAVVMFGSGTDDGDGADWPSFTGVYEVQSRVGNGLDTTRWRIDWRSRREWTVEVVGDPAPSVGPTIGTRQTFADSRWTAWDAPGPDGERSVVLAKHSDAWAPSEWLSPARFTDVAIAANPKMSRRTAADGTLELVRTDEIPCLQDDRGPDVLRCAPGKDTTTEVVVYELGPHNLPLAHEVRYDGEVVGRSRFLELDWDESRSRR